MFTCFFIFLLPTSVCLCFSFGNLVHFVCHIGKCVFGVYSERSKSSTSEKAVAVEIPKIDSKACCHAHCMLVFASSTLHACVLASSSTPNI